MKPSTRLSLAVFQLTPTRTRCDLIIIANEKKEKISSGLLNPFLAHLKTAQDQIAKGGYSIFLEPSKETDAAWFTKATLERFIRFVSTPEILERVYMIETEILQIEEAISMQRSSDIRQNNVEDHCGNPPEGFEVSNKAHQAKRGKSVKSSPNANEETAIVPYKLGVPLCEANGSCLQEENSKVHLLEVLETRKAMLHKEQGMAFARAAAAGFDIDHMALLLSFAECFGALRLMEACSRFVDLWKRKHESGEWLDIEASEALPTGSDFLAMNTSGVVLPATHNKHDESNHELASEDNGKSSLTYNKDNQAPTGQQVYIQGQFPHMVFPPWLMHPPPGAQPAFQAYPVQGIQYYQTHQGSGPFFQSPHHPMEHSQSNLGHQPGQDIQSLDGSDSKSGSEMWGPDSTRSMGDMDMEVSGSRKPQKEAGGSNRKKSRVVVIQNINYITSKQNQSGSESDSDSNIDRENEKFEADDHDVIHGNSTSSSESKGNHLKSVDKLYSINDEVSNLRKDTDDGNWQTFQNCLLRGSDKDARACNEGTFSIEKDVIVKRHATESVDPLVHGARDTPEIQDTGMIDIHKFSGSTSCRLAGSSDDALLSRMDHDQRGSNDDIQFAEINGSKILSRTTHEDFIIGSEWNQDFFRNSSNPLALSSFEGVMNKIDVDSTHGMTDETFIVPYRSISIDQVEEADRIAIDVDSEIQSSHKKLDSEGNICYEPDDLCLIPERETENMPLGYDPALDYEMQVCTEGINLKEGKEATEVKGGLRKSDKDRRSKVSDSLYKQRTGGPLTKGKSLKMIPPEDARARAEKLRSYKADLQNMKKEKEEEEAKRLEALRLERQRRIAARGSSTSGKSAHSPQTKQFPARLSPASTRGSKFSDSEPGSSSPLQRSKIKTSLGSSELLKTSKASKLSVGSHMVGNRLTKSSSSFSEVKIENNDSTPDSKASMASMARIRRLSEPKTANPPATLAKVKARSIETVSKQKLSDGPERNKIAAIINLDRSKAATLPELRIKTSKSDIDEACQVDAEDLPTDEKTVVMLELEKPSHPNFHSSGLNSEVRNQS